MEFLFIALVAVVVFRLLLPSKGEAGERKAAKRLRRLLDKQQYFVLSDLLLPALNGTTQIDLVVVSRYGLWIIEVKNYDGWIFASPTDKQWTQTIYKEKNRFQNPLHQNFKHLKAIEAITGVHHRGMKNIVLFVGSAKFKTEQPDGVYRGFNELKLALSQETNLRFTDPDAKRIAEQLTAADKACREGTTSRQHIKKLKADHKPAKLKGDAPKCPRCESAMAVRTSRKTGEQFWGCTQFPACKGTRKAC